MKNIPTKAVRVLGFGGKLLFFLRFLFFGLFLAYLIISIIIIAIDKRDMVYAIKEIGKEFLTPIKSSVNSIDEIKQNPSFWSYFGLYYSLYKIYIVFWVLMIPVNFALKDANPLMIRLPIAILLFYTILVLYYSIILKESPNMPFILSKNLLLGLKELITNPSFNWGFEVFKSNNTCSEGICQI